MNRWALLASLYFDNNFILLLVMMLLAIAFAATQDIATDALAIGILKPSERGLGNSIQVVGGYLGSILGGGVVLIGLDTLGWNKSLLLMAGGVFTLILPVLFYRESKTISPSNSP